MASVEGKVRFKISWVEVIELGGGDSRRQEGLLARFLVVGRATPSKKGAGC